MIIASSQLRKKADPFFLNKLTIQNPAYRFVAFFINTVGRTIMVEIGV